MFYTYILQSKKDKKWYTGATDDLRKRLIEHNQNEVQSTKSRGPFDIIYYEACKDIHDAYAREKYLKSGQSKKFLKNRIKRFLSLTGQDKNKVHPVRSKSSRMTATSNGGFATLEILIAFAVLILCISAVILLAFSNQTIAVDSETNNEALYKAKKMLEDARAASRFDFNLVNPIPAAADDVYTKKLDVSMVDFFTKEVTSDITWKVEGGRNQTISLSTLLTNPEAVDGGSTCDSVLSGDWTQPQITSYEFGKDLIGDPSSGFPIGDIDVKDHKLYVVVNNSNGNNMPTFFKFDVSNPTQPPSFISSMDNNGSVKAGLNAVHVAGDYAYVANANGANYNTCTTSLSCSQLQIINLNTMTVAGKLKIPGVTGNNGKAIGSSIFYKDGIVYIGLAKTGAGSEFNIIDVGGGGMAGASPTNPIFLGSYPIGNGVNAIYVKDGYAYVASPNDEELKILNVSSPSSPYQVGQYNAPLGGGNNGNGKSISLVGNTLYLGRTLLAGDEFYILDDTNPNSSLSVLGSKDIRDTSNNNTSINGILIRDYLAFLLTNSDFQVLKINNSVNPYTITQYAVPQPTPGGSGTTMDCEGNYIFYASLPSNDKGYIAVVTSKP